MILLDDINQLIYQQIPIEQVYGQLSYTGLASEYLPNELTTEATGLIVMYVYPYPESHYV